jgi:hypothetical protein
MVGQLARDACVLAGDQVGRRQHFEGAQGDVAQIADRRGDKVKPGRKRGCDRLAPPEHVVAGRALGGGGSRPCRRGRGHAGSLATIPFRVIAGAEKAIFFIWLTDNRQNA